MSYPSSTETSALAAVSNRTGVRVRTARLLLGAWAAVVYAAYWLGYLPGAR